MFIRPTALVRWRGETAALAGPAAAITPSSSITFSNREADSGLQDRYRSLARLIMARILAAAWPG
jgi:hypothetical protein